MGYIEVGAKEDMFRMSLSSIKIRNMLQMQRICCVCECAWIDVCALVWGDRELITIQMHASGHNY